MARTGAALLIESLVAAGVKYLFSLSGNQILPIYDATLGRDIEIIHTRHEAAAVHMADGWGRLTEQPGVALLTAGPGHANGLSALYVALMAESPLLLLSGHAPLSQSGRGAFQEIDQVSMAKPVTKAAWLVERADRLDQEIAAALTLAQAGRPGPVHLSLPDDILRAEVSATSSGAASTGPRNGQGDAIASPQLDEALVAQLLAHVQSAKRPLILAGPALSRPLRWQAVEQLSETTGIPALPMDSPRGVNDPALHLAVNKLCQADVVLLAGKKLDFSLRYGRPPFFAPACRFIQIDAEAEQGARNEAVILAIQGEPTQILQQLAAAASERSWPARSWQAEVAEARRRVPSEWEAWRRSERQPIHPLRVCQALRPFLDEGAILISDGGEFGQWAQAGLEAKTRLSNGPSGSIGSSLPLALAARLAYPQQPVFALLGDGSFGFHAMEFDTALRYRLPIIAIVGNDAGWNAERQLQIKTYGPERTVSCDLLLSRYDKLVEALGGHGEFVRRPDELEPALWRAVESGLPACVNVAIEGVAAPTLLAG
jgi:acetolactate synthase-1/2/3 large subunit